MNPDAQHPQDSSQDDQILADLFVQLTDRMQGGERVDLDRICHQYPQYADELRQLWGTVLVTEAIGSQQSSNQISELETSAAFELPADFGEYQLLEELGRGGMGVVYRAKHRPSANQVALKMVLQGELASPTTIKRFRLEAQAAKGLNHPNIIKITDVGQHEGRAYFCMQLIAGETLSQRLLRGPLSARQAARILAPVSHAIEFAHQNGILHRDLKPSNILLDADETPYLVDFGLARHEQTEGESLTRTGSVIGTPAYMAPEQAAGDRGRVAPTSDVYSLGAILYHMLTGRPPFQAASPVDTVLMLLEQDPIAPRVLNRQADRELEMVAMRCLQKPQDLRYRTAGELARDLDTYLAGGTVSARLGRFGHVISSLLSETHHAGVMENWGLLWMWHSLALFVACFCTQTMKWAGVESRWYYWLLWIAGFGAWAIVFWWLRRRRGPVTFVERQIAHLWLGSIICIGAMFPLEGYMDLPPLKLSPILALVSGTVFLVKASILSGSFYVYAIVLYATAFLMAAFPEFDLLIFGLVSAACFFFAGLKYHRLTKTEQPFQ